MGGQHRPPTPHDRALGAELRAIREQRQLTLTSVAHQIKWNISTLSRLERGQRGVSPEAVMGLSMIYQLPTRHRADLIARAKDRPALDWWHRPPPGVPADLCTLASYEHEATQITTWSPGVIPDLLQTPAYATAILHERGTPDPDLRVRLQALRRRQDLLNNRHTNYTAFIATAALTNPLCAPDDFATQLHHLTHLTDHDGVTIRLVESPTAFALSSWSLLTFATAGPIALPEHLGSPTFLFDEEARPYTTARTQLTELALTPPATQAKITTLTSHLTHATISPT